MSVDPLAAKYANISPYAYVAGNPIKYIDPDGRKIRLAKYDKKKFKSRKEYRKFKKTVLKRAQALTNDRLKLRGRKIVIKKKGAANTGKSLKEGTKLVSDLISDDNTVAIAKGGKNLTKSASASNKNSRNGVGNDAIVFFNDSDETTAVNVDGTTGRPSFIGLAHELIHADNITNGTQTINRLPNLYDPSTNGKRVLKDEEVNTRARENIIRKEHGVIGRMTPYPKTK